MGRNPKDDIRKPQILDHFRQVINEVGLHKASNARVAEHMGVSANLVAHYFKSKDDMILELLESIVSGYIGHISQLSDSQTDQASYLKELIRNMFCVRDNSQPLIEHSYYALYNHSLTDKSCKEKFINYYNGFRQQFINDIQAAMNAGEIRKGDSKKLAEVVLSLFEGFTFLANLSDNDEYLDEFGDFFYQKAWSILKG